MGHGDWVEIEKDRVQLAVDIKQCVGFDFKVTQLGRRSETIVERREVLIAPRRAANRNTIARIEKSICYEKSNSNEINKICV
jgi:hypothetical protein